MNIYKTFFFSIMVSSFFMGAPSFSGKPESFVFDSFAELRVEGQPSKHATIPQMKKGDLVLMGGRTILSKIKEEEKEPLKNTLDQLNKNGVKVNLITSRGSAIIEPAKTTQTEQDLVKLGLDFKSWNTLVLEEGLLLEGPEGGKDDAYIVKNGIIYNIRDKTPGQQPHKSAAIYALLKKLEAEKNLPSALYFIDGHQREMDWVMEDIKDSPIPLYLLKYGKDLSTSVTDALKKQ